MINTCISCLLNIIDNDIIGIITIYSIYIYIVVYSCL